MSPNIEWSPEPIDRVDETARFRFDTRPSISAEPFLTPVLSGIEPSLIDNVNRHMTATAVAAQMRHQETWERIRSNIRNQGWRIGLRASDFPATTERHAREMERAQRQAAWQTRYGIGHPMLTVKDDHEDHEAAIRSLNEQMAMGVSEIIRFMRFANLRDHFNRRNLR